MRLVVTGGCGFIGSNFLLLALKHGWYDRIVNIDKITYAANLAATLPLWRHESYSLVREDICNQNAMEGILEAGDIVVNFAAESHVDRSIADESVFLKTNVLGVQSLLSAAKKKKVSLFVQISTDEVYGSLELGDPSSRETDILRPSSPYSASKAAAEMLCFAAMRTFSQPIIITRSSNNFGPFQYPEKIIPHFITRLQNGQTVPVYGDGQNIRDWIFVEDNCEAIQQVISKGEIGEIYNIGGGNEVSNLDLTRTILSNMGLDDSRIEFVADRLGHDRRYSLGCDKIHRLGWKPKQNFSQGIIETIEWYKQHQPAIA